MSTQVPFTLSSSIIRRLMVWQMISLLLASGIGAIWLKQLAIFILLGGGPILLANITFFLFTEYTLTHYASMGFHIGLFVIAWFIKFMIAIMFMMLTIIYCKQHIMLLGIGFFSVLMMQWIAPIMFNIIDRTISKNKIRGKRS